MGRSNISVALFSLQNMPGLCPNGTDLGVTPSAPSCPATLPLYPRLPIEHTESQRTPSRKIALVSVETQTEIQTAQVGSKQLLSQYDLRLLWFQ